jgi:hypothetical protein
VGNTGRNGHGKGAFTFLACLIIRFADGSGPLEIELQSGEIGSETDTMEVLQLLGVASIGAGFDPSFA